MHFSKKNVHELSFRFADKISANIFILFHYCPIKTKKNLLFIVYH